MIEKHFALVKELRKRSNEYKKMARSRSPEILKWHYTEMQKLLRQAALTIEELAERP